MVGSPHDRRGGCLIAGNWFPYRKPNNRARLRLLCFSHAGGTASSFLPWARDLPPDVEVCPVQFPGRESRLTEPPLASCEQLIAGLLPALLPMTQMPFALFGHSMGALVAFELVRELRRRASKPPAQLFVSGCRAPHLPYRKEPIWNLPSARFVSRLRELNGTPHEVLCNEELMALLLPTLRADFAVIETYQHAAEPALDVPIRVFGGTDDPEVTREELEGWSVQTSQPMVAELIPGDHFFTESSGALLRKRLSLALESILEGLPLPPT